MTGRGAWNTAGVGGTKKYNDASTPGPYYFIGSGRKPVGRERDSNEYAVYRAVVAYQKALNRRLGTNIDITGVFNDATYDAVFEFQEEHEDVTGTPWGGIGPETSEALLRPDAEQIVIARKTRVTLNMVTGTVRSESLWDAGAVGYLDDSDLGLAQINGPAHPTWSARRRLKVRKSFNFIIDYYVNALSQLGNNQRDAVASYNLGIGGARSWISDGRPDVWTPAGSSRPRDVKKYIDKILEG